LPRGPVALEVDRAGQRENVIDVSAVHEHPETNLLDVAQALGLLRGGLSLGEDGEQDGGKDRDDRDNDEKFNKSKCAIASLRRSPVGRGA
jgi:hypothetical protein